MINVTHNAYNRWSCHKCIFRIILILKKFCYNIYFNFMFAYTVIFKGNFFSRCKINILIDCNNLSLKEQILNKGCRLDFHLISKFLDCKCIRKNKCLDYIFIGFFFFLLVKKILFKSLCIFKLFRLIAEIIILLTIVLSVSVTLVFCFSVF